MHLQINSNTIWIEIVDLLGKIIIPLCIGWVTLIIAKKQISNLLLISERQIANTGITQFRQKWIDNLRDSISLFVAKAEMISMLSEEDNEHYFEHFKELSMMQYKIRLMLNSDENDHNEIISIVDDIRDIIHDEESYDDDKFDEILDDAIEQLMEITSSVLKREWKVVKQGK